MDSQQGLFISENRDSGECSRRLDFPVDTRKNRRPLRAQNNSLNSSPRHHHTLRVGYCRMKNKTLPPRICSSFHIASLVTSLQPAHLYRAALIHSPPINLSQKSENHLYFPLFPSPSPLPSGCYVLVPELLRG